MRVFTALCLLVGVAAFSACGDDVACGDGTELVSGECVVMDAGMIGGDVDSSVPPPVDSGNGDPDPMPMTCGDGTHAEDGECVPDATKKPVGGACTTADECQTGTTCLPPMDNLPGGLCTVLNCSMDNPCPTGSTCYALNKSLSLCMPFCDRASQCRTDYQCQPLYTTSLNICAPSCELTKSCSAGTRCNTESGLCELSECEVASPGNACNDQETCYADSKGLSSKGGLCLDLCETADPKTCLVDKGEVCQPFPNDLSKGFCAPPVCTKTSECPAGAECKNSVCQPPALCSNETPCADDATTCVSGKCMPKCPTGETQCDDIHPGLVCAGVLSVPACLPLGSFPGSACRSGSTNRCDGLKVGEATVAMVCENDVCLADCTTGGDPLCSGLSPTLQCARDIFATDLCLPKGSYPGSECGGGNTCAQDLNGDPSIDMTCADGTCVVTCSEAGKWPGYGDTLCSVVDASLTCSTSAGSICVRGCGEGGACATGYSCLDAGALPAHENACLPDGSFPGSACRPSSGDACDSDLGGNAAVDMVCQNNRCVVSCPSNNDVLCTGVSPVLTCSESAGNLCLPACVSGACPTGFSCLSPGAENACLPTGTFPGSPCRGTQGDQCDQNLGGVAAVDMQCVEGVCLIGCATGGDQLCGGVNAALTCSESAGNVCLPACVSGACPTGLSCLSPGVENACLPTGSFPGSPCRSTQGDQCDENVGGVDAIDLVCSSGVCTVSCPSNNDALCTTVNAALTCSETAGNICVVGCNGGSCPTGFSCLDPGTERACLPNGTFPGSDCRTGQNQCDQDLFGQGGIDMTCASGTCVVQCPQDNNNICNFIDQFLTCYAPLNICMLECGDNDSCPQGTTCDTGEDVCVPGP